MSRAPSGLEPQVSITELAKEVGQPRKRFAKRIERMIKKDRIDGRGHWLICRGPRSKALINLARLRAEHPGMFTATAVGREEVEELEERVLEAEKKASEAHARATSALLEVRKLAKAG